MSNNTSRSKTDRHAQQEAQDRALAYPEPSPHPLWARPGRPRYGPLNRAQQQYNQELLLRGLRTHTQPSRTEPSR